MSDEHFRGLGGPFLKGEKTRDAHDAPSENSWLLATVLMRVWVACHVMSIHSCCRSDDFIHGALMLPTRILVKQLQMLMGWLRSH